MTVRELRHDTDDFRDIDIAFTSAGAGISRDFAEDITRYGAVMIDNTSAFRMDEDVPLVVPECNATDALNRPRGIIANPNCTTIMMVVALQAIERLSHIRRVHVASYQAASGAGQAAMDELEAQHRALAAGETPHVEKFAYQLAYNVIPQIDVFTDNGYTKEEMKMYNETRKIMHSDDVYVGRIRKDLANPNGMTFWLVSDQIKKGAALNAVQIAEWLIANNGLKA